MLQELFPVFSTMLLSIDILNINTDAKASECLTKQRLLIEDMTLKQMLKCVKADPPTFASPFLTLILYKLSSLSQSKSFSYSMMEHNEEAATSELGGIALWGVMIASKYFLNT